MSRGRFWALVVIVLVVVCAFACGGNEQTSPARETLLQPTPESLYDCDGGLTLDAGTEADAGSTLTADASPTTDAGSSCLAPPDLWMPINVLRTRAPVAVLCDGDSIGSIECTEILQTAGIARASDWKNLTVLGKLMSTMDEQFAEAGAPFLASSDAGLKIASTNGGVNDMRSGSTVTPSETCAHLASWCSQAHAAGATSIVFEMSPSWQSYMSLAEQDQYVACEDGLVAAGTCDYAIRRDLSWLVSDGDGGYVESTSVGCTLDGLHPTDQCAYRAVARYTQLVAHIVDPSDYPTLPSFALAAPGRN